MSCLHSPSCRFLMKLNVRAFYIVSIFGNFCWTFDFFTGKSSGTGWAKAETFIELLLFKPLQSHVAIRYPPCQEWFPIKIYRRKICHTQIAYCNLISSKLEFLWNSRAIWIAAIVKIRCFFKVKSDLFSKLGSRVEIINGRLRTNFSKRLFFWWLASLLFHLDLAQLLPIVNCKCGSRVFLTLCCPHSEPFTFCWLRQELFSVLYQSVNFWIFERLFNFYTNSSIRTFVHVKNLYRNIKCENYSNVFEYSYPWQIFVQTFVSVKFVSLCPELQIFLGFGHNCRFFIATTWSMQLKATHATIK